MPVRLGLSNTWISALTGTRGRAFLNISADPGMLSTKDNWPVGKKSFDGRREMQAIPLPQRLAGRMPVGVPVVVGATPGGMPGADRAVPRRDRPA
jgi:hypothetical protein